MKWQDGICHSHDSIPIPKHLKKWKKKLSLYVVSNWE